MGSRIPESRKSGTEPGRPNDAIDPFSTRGLTFYELALEKAELLFSEGDEIDHVYVVRSGLCYRYRYLKDGRRQIVDLAFPGDFIGLEALTQDSFVNSLTALTPARVAAYPVSEFIRQCYAEPSLVRVLLEWMARGQSILTKRLLGGAHGSASQRIAHLLLEIRLRALFSIRLEPKKETHFSLLGVDDTELNLKLPQAIIADTLGLSIVHVSRTLTSLREDGFIEQSATGLRYRNLDGLKDLALWDD